MNLHPESQRLADDLEGLNVEEPTLKSMAIFNRASRAKGARALGVEQRQQLEGLFSWLSDTASSGISAVTGRAASMGLTAALPFAKDILLWEGKKRNARSLALRLQSAQQTQLPRLLALKNAKADQFYENIRGQFTTAIQHLNASQTTMDKALSTAQAAKKVMDSGHFPAQYTAIYLVQKKAADTAYGRAISEGQNVYKTMSNFVQSNTERPTAASYVGAAGSTVKEAATKAAKGFQRVGQEIEKAAPGAAAMIKYLPYLAVAGFGLYVLSWLPRAPRATTTPTK